MSRPMKVIEALRFAFVSPSSVTPSFACCASTITLSATPTTLTRIATDTINSIMENPAARFIFLSSIEAVRIALGILGNVTRQRVLPGKTPGLIIDGDDDLPDRRLVDDIADRDRPRHLIEIGYRDNDVVGGSENSIGSRLDNAVQLGQIIVGRVYIPSTPGSQSLAAPLRKTPPALTF